MRDLTDGEGGLCWCLGLTHIFLSLYKVWAITSLMNEGDHQVPAFYRRELAQALNEQAFGISRSEIIHCNEGEAEATVTLLEGNTINVVLLSAGYKVWR